MNFSNTMGYERLILSTLTLDSVPYIHTVHPIGHSICRYLMQSKRVLLIVICWVHPWCKPRLRDNQSSSNAATLIHMTCVNYSCICVLRRVTECTNTQLFQRGTWLFQTPWDFHRFKVFQFSRPLSSWWYVGNSEFQSRASSHTFCISNLELIT